MIHKICKSLLPVFFWFCALLPSVHAQVSSEKAELQSLSYSYEFIGNVFVVYEHRDGDIRAFYAMQNEEKPIVEAIKNIEKVDYIKSGKELTLTYSDQSKVVFSTKVDRSGGNFISCYGISHHYNDEGFTKDSVRKLIASWE
jgi:hypothetical protein